MNGSTISSREVVCSINTNALRLLPLRLLTWKTITILGCISDVAIFAEEQYSKSSVYTMVHWLWMIREGLVIPGGP